MKMIAVWRMMYVLVLWSFVKFFFCVLLVSFLILIDVVMREFILKSLCV